MRAALLLAALVALSAAALPAAAQSVDGLPLVGRWLALSVRGDDAATADLAFGRLEKVLVVHPGGRVLLRGTDHVLGEGRSPQFSGRLRGRRLRFDGLPGTATLRADGRRLVFTDPRGVETLFLRLPPD